MASSPDTQIDLSLLTAEEREMWTFRDRASTNIPTLICTLAETRKVLREIQMCADCWPKNQQLQDLIKLLPKEEAKL